MAVAKQASDLHTATVTQLAAAASCRPTTSTRTSSGSRAVYRERRDALLDGLPDALPAGLDLDPPRRAACSAGRGSPRVRRRGAAARVVDADVAYVPGVPFHAGEPDRRTLRLSYSEPTPERIALGLERLGPVLRGAPPA